VNISKGEKTSCRARSVSPIAASEDEPEVQRNLEQEGTDLKHHDEPWLADSVRQR
jgi:hypothetical protein